MRRLALLFTATLLVFLATRAFADEEESSGPTISTVRILENPSHFSASLTRAEGLELALRSREQFAPQILWFTENLPAIPLFSDIAQSDPIAPYAEVAFLEGIMTGYGDGTFHPHDPLTTEQAIVLLSRVHRFDGATAFRTSPFLENREAQWYTEAVSQMIERNFIGDASLFLGAPMSRSAFLGVLERIEAAEKHRSYVYEDSQDSQGTQTRTRTSSVTAPAPSSRSRAPVPLRVTPLPSHAPLPLPEVASPIANDVSPSLAFASSQFFAITIPKVGLFDVPVNHPADAFTQEGMLAPLELGAGHLFSYPGTGLAMIYFHSSNYWYKNQKTAELGANFDQLVPGDRVYVTYAGKLHVYEITSDAVISPQDTSHFEEDGTEKLILYTCWPPKSTTFRRLEIGVPVETVAVQTS